jgi:hypothetical protein
MSCKYDGFYYCLRGYLKRNAGERCRYYEKLKIYLCGKITGDDQYRDKFLDGENELLEAGFYPVNPAARIPPDTAWNDAMRKAVGLMLKCDGVALLSDWRESKGAAIEVNLARKIGIPVRPIHEWEKLKLV